MQYEFNQSEGLIYLIREGSVERSIKAANKLI